ARACPTSASNGSAVSATSTNRSFDIPERTHATRVLAREGARGSGVARVPTPRRQDAGELRAPRALPIPDVPQLRGIGGQIEQLGRHRRSLDVLPRTDPDRAHVAGHRDIVPAGVVDAALEEESSVARRSGATTECRAEVDAARAQRSAVEPEEREDGRRDVDQPDG